MVNEGIGDRGSHCTDILPSLYHGCLEAWLDAGLPVGTGTNTSLVLSLGKKKSMKPEEAKNRIADVQRGALQQLKSVDEDVAVQCLGRADVIVQRAEIEQLLRSPKATQLNLCKVLTFRETCILGKIRKPRKRRLPIWRCGGDNPWYQELFGGDDGDEADDDFEVEEG